MSKTFHRTDVYLFERPAIADAALTMKEGLIEEIESLVKDETR